MKKDSGQTLVLVLFIVIIFTAVVVTIAALSTRSLEMREIDEMAQKSSYASESGYERGMYYLKNNSPLNQKTIRETCEGDEGDCRYACIDSINCNQAGAPEDDPPNCDCDLNPMQNEYAYRVTITPNGQLRPNGDICDEYEFCIDTQGISPE